MERLLSGIFAFITALNFLGPDSKRQYLKKFLEKWEQEVGPAYYEQFKQLKATDIPLLELLDKHDCDFPAMEEHLAEWMFADDAKTGKPNISEDCAEAVLARIGQISQNQ